MVLVLSCDFGTVVWLWFRHVVLVVYSGFGSVPRFRFCSMVLVLSCDFSCVIWFWPVVLCGFGFVMRFQFVVGFRFYCRVSVLSYGFGSFMFWFRRVFLVLL